MSDAACGPRPQDAKRQAACRIPVSSFDLLTEFPYHRVAGSPQQLDHIVQSFAVVMFGRGQAVVDHFFESFQAIGGPASRQGDRLGDGDGARCLGRSTASFAGLFSKHALQIRQVLPDLVVDWSI